MEKDKSFEESMQELEDNNLNLDESVKKFEEGMKISKKCNQILEQAEKKISILLENNGEIEEKEFKIEE